MGGAVAAPIFKRVAEASLRHLGIAPTVNPVPPVLVAAGPRPMGGDDHHAGQTGSRAGTRPATG